jgi:3-dehydroquinate synthetase
MISLLSKYGLSTSLPTHIQVDSLIEFMTKDKKNKDSKIGIVTINSIGNYNENLLFLSPEEIITHLHPDTMISSPINVDKSE